MAACREEIFDEAPFPALSLAGEQFISERLNTLKQRLDTSAPSEQISQAREIAKTAAQFMHLTKVQERLRRTTRTGPPEYVDIGSVITVLWGRNEKTDPRETYLIVPDDCYDKDFSVGVGIISNNAKLAKTLMDKKSGFSGKMGETAYFSLLEVK